MSAPDFMGDVTRVRGRDAGFTEAISQKMRVPERLRVGPAAPGGEEDEEEVGRRQRQAEPPPSYSMHIPDRLALTDAPDMSPRPLFKPGSSSPALPPGAAWDSQQSPWDRDSYLRDPFQGSMRRSYSDTAFEKSPLGTATYSKQTLHTPSSRSAGRPPQRSAAPPQDAPPHPPPPDLPAVSPHLLSPQAVLQAARQLGQQASQRLLQTVTQKYRSRFGQPDQAPAAVAEAPVRSVEQGRKSAMQESWLNAEEEGGTAVEFIVLRRQVVKMSRRLAGVERQNTERRQTELVLFSLLLSACLLNGWLWIRR